MRPPFFLILYLFLSFDESRRKRERDRTEKERKKEKMRASIWSVALKDLKRRIGSLLVPSKMAKLSICSHSIENNCSLFVEQRGFRMKIPKGDRRRDVMRQVRWLIYIYVFVEDEGRKKQKKKKQKKRSEKTFWWCCIGQQRQLPLAS